MKKYILLSLSLSAVLSLSSCKKFLEEQSQTDVIPKNARDLNELLIGEAYNTNGTISFDASLRLLDDDVTQDAFYNVTNNLFGAYTWQPETALEPDMMVGAQVWFMRYPRIMTCNLVLEYLPEMSGTTAEKENVEGQAYLLRAYNYFLLVNYYGKPYTDALSDPEQDLGVPLILTGNLSLEGKPRNTVAEVYRQILSDLEKGIPLMERSGKNNNPFRISHIGGYLLASRVHLYMGNWQKAIEAASNVLSRKSALMDLASWGAAAQDTKTIISMQNQEAIWGHGQPQGVIVHDALSEENNYRLSDELLALFEPGDLRTSIYIRNKRSIKRPSLVVNARVAETFRVSEALLNRAEAYAQLNKLGQTANEQLALNDLNLLRKKRFATASYQDLSITSPDDLLQKCREERRRELFGEEQHRWFDLRRYGMPAFGHVVYESNAQSATYFLKERDPAYLLQIPQDVLQKNPKLIPNPVPEVRTGQ